MLYFAASSDHVHQIFGDNNCAVSLKTIQSLIRGPNFMALNCRGAKIMIIVSVKVFYADNADDDLMRGQVMDVDWLVMSATTSKTSNSTSSGGTTAETAVDGPRWHFLPLAIVPLWILVGNSLVLLAVVRQRSLRTLSNSVIASLAFADFLLALLVVPLGVYQLVSPTTSQ